MAFHPRFTTQLEKAAFSLAKEYETKQISRRDAPTDPVGNPLSAADIAHMLLGLPREPSRVKALVRVLDTQYHNIPLDMVGRWHVLRQQVEAAEGYDEAAEKENAPPPPPLLAKLDDDDVPTHPAEGGTESADFPMPSSRNASRSVLVSPTPQPSFGQPGLAASPDPSSDVPGPSHSILAVPLPPDDTPSYGDVVAVSQDVEVASERDVEEAEGLAADSSTPDDAPSTEDEENPRANTISSPSLASPSSPSSPLHSSTFAQNPSSPTLRTRLVRSNGVSNFQDLKLVWTSQETATSDVDFFNTPPVNAISTPPLFNPVPPLAAQSTMNSGNHNLQSPTLGTGTVPRDGLRRVEEEGEAIVDGLEQDEGQDVLTSNIAVTVPSTSNRRKRAREDDQEREDDRPPANRDGQDNFAARFWRRLKRYLP